MSSSLDYLRQKIKELNILRADAVLEKGLAAEENKDLRENFAYDYWVEKEMTITIKIGSLIKEIERLSKTTLPPKKKKVIKSRAEKPVKKIRDLPKNKWL